MQNGFRTGLPTKTERLAAGRALREKIKRGELGRWRPKSDRSDPIDLIEEAHSGRLERLIPVRIGTDGGLPLRVPSRSGFVDGRGF